MDKQYVIYLYNIILFSNKKEWNSDTCGKHQKHHAKYQVKEARLKRQLNVWFQFCEISRGFPGGAVVKNPPANAGDTGSSPGLGRSHMPQIPHGATKPMCHNYWACALEPMSHNYWAHMSQLLKPAHLEPVLCNKRSHRNEKPVHRNEEWPLLTATRESLHAATKTQCSQKEKKKNKKSKKGNFSETEGRSVVA